MKKRVYQSFKLKTKEDNIRNFIDKFYFLKKKKNHASSKLVFIHTDDFWNIDLLDMIDMIIWNLK